MNIKKLTESINRALYENEETIDYTIEDAKKVVMDYGIEDLIDTYDLLPIAESLAENVDCKIYGDSGLRNYLVKKVKGMPNIDEDKAGLDFSKEEDCKKVDEAIQIFAGEMEQKYGDDFAIVGRSGGYWGLSDVESHIEISEHGYETLANLLLDRFNKVDRESYPTLGDVMFVDDRDLGLELLKDSENFEFEKDYIEKMQSLIKDIEDEEVAMNTKKYWEQF